MSDDTRDELPDDVPGEEPPSEDNSERLELTPEVPDVEDILDDDDLNDDTWPEDTAPPARVTPDFPEQPEIQFETAQEPTDPVDESTLTDEERLRSIPLLRENFERVQATLVSNANLMDELAAEQKALSEMAERLGTYLTPDQGSYWYRTFIDSLRTGDMTGTTQRATARTGSDWRQRVEHEGRGLRAGYPTQNVRDQKPQGAEARRMMERKAGAGTTFDVPLWHSGLWLRLRTPNTVQLAQLQHQLGEVRVDMGSDTKGLAFSNASQILTSIVLDFCLDYVTTANVHFTTASDLKGLIQQPDIPVVLWAMACAMYPKGVLYSHPCMADPKECTHVAHERLRPSRLYRVDHNSLSEVQKKLMGRRFSQFMTDDDLVTYHTHHVLPQTKLVWIGDVAIQLKVPNALDYEKAGQHWYQSIIDMTHGAFNEPPHGQRRNRYINRLADATSARQYEHWIKAVGVANENQDSDEEAYLYEEEDTIRESLINIFSNEDQIVTFMDHVTAFINETLLSLVAIEAFRCPSCDTPIAREFYDRFPHLVGVDVLNAFFMLVNRKLS